MTPYKPVPSVMSVSGCMCLIMSEIARGVCVCVCVCGNNQCVNPTVMSSCPEGQQSLVLPRVALKEWGRALEDDI